jgi:hypothetical protein
VTLPSRGLPELDIRRVSAAYQRVVAAACPEHLPLAMGVLEHLEPRRWALEWHLPWWLGHSFGLDPETAEELVLSNVLGLASIRLQDDLADGDIGICDRAAAKALSAALYQAALAPYHSRFPAPSPFWRHLGSCMSTWDAATRGPAQLALSGGGGPCEGLDDRLDSRASRRLAARGAPLKIAAFAVCRLAGRADAYRALDQCLDHALTALVLRDHSADWRADLAAGRWNAFIAGASDNPQEPEFRVRNRSRVLVAMMTEDAVSTYFARITMELTRAAEVIEALGVSPLDPWLREQAVLTEEQGSVLQSHYSGIAERAGRLLAGASTRGRSQDGHRAAAVLGKG